MPAPKVEQVGGCLRFEWEIYKIAVTLDRFRDSGRSGVNAEFQATTTAPGYQPHLTMGQINLTALKTRADFAKRLTNLYPEANWDVVMETVCVVGLRKLRQGEPVLRLSDHSDIQPPSIRLAPLVHDGLPTILFGPGGIGKSYLALFCSMLVEYGGWEAGLCGVPGPTLYVDYESDYGDLVNRAKKIRKGHPHLAGSEPLYRRCHLPLADDLPALQRLVAESGIKFLVIDSLAAACGAELERAETAIRFFTALRSLRVATLILAHVAKNAEEKSIYGSVFFSNFARSAWEMKKAQEAGEPITRIGLYHRKSNLGALEKPLGFKLHFGETVQLEPTDLLEEPGLVDGLPVKDRLQAVLKVGALTAKELAEETGIPLASVKARLSEGQGLWSTKTGGEKWGLLRRG
jgi:AAA domain